MSNGSFARAEIAMIVHKRNKTGFGEGASEASSPCSFTPRIAMGEGDGRNLSSLS